MILNLYFAFIKILYSIQNVMARSSAHPLAFAAAATFFIGWVALYVYTKGASDPNFGWGNIIFNGVGILLGLATAALAFRATQQSHAAVEQGKANHAHLLHLHERLDGHKEHLVAIRKHVTPRRPSALKKTTAKKPGRTKKP